MAEGTAISWADDTFNPWVGCTKVSPACDNCYAETWAKRAGQPELWDGQRRRTSAANWQKPRRWNAEAIAAGRRRRVFCASLADVFDNQVPSGWREDLWHLIQDTPALDWLLLTKRPQMIRRFLPDPRTGVQPWGNGWPNVWLGTTAENQEEADRRIWQLLAIPAALRFISCEPLLGALDLRHLNTGREGWGWLDSLHGSMQVGRVRVPMRRIDWVIAGGESGPGARAMHPDWARSLRDQCTAASVPFHFKQWGEWAPVGRVFGNPDHPPGQAWERIGVKRAGRALDGSEHLAVPDRGPA